MNEQLERLEKLILELNERVEKLSDRKAIIGPIIDEIEDLQYDLYEYADYILDLIKERLKAYLAELNIK
jgi:hypothetical protein